MFGKRKEVLWGSAAALLNRHFWNLFTMSLIPFFFFGVVTTGPLLAMDSVSADEFVLEELTVTAEKRATDLQKTAASVAVRKGDELTRQGKYGLTQILEDIPGVSGGATIGSDTQGTGIVIRGALPSEPPAGSGISSVPTTAVYVDDVFEGVGGDYDIDRVELLRGPQGTLYGRSATGGVVSIHTKDPLLEEFDIDASAEFGSYDLKHITAAVNVPLGETMALRLAGSDYRRDGYVSDEGGRREVTGLRTKFLYEPDGAFSLQLGWAMQDSTEFSGGTLVSLSAPDTFIFSAAPVASTDYTSRQYWGKLNWDLGPATLTYIPAFRTWEKSGGMVLAGPGGLILKQDGTTPKDDFTTHEIRLSSSDESVFSWLVGGFYYNNELEDDGGVRAFDTGALGFSTLTSRDTKATGAFAEVTYPIAESWRVTGGLRYDDTKIDTNQLYTMNFPPFMLPENTVTLSIEGDTGKSSYKTWNYKLRFEKDLTPSNLLFATISTGFLPGDVQAGNGAGGQPIAMRYDEETLTAFEIGSKNRFLDNTLQINANVYYYDYEGYQTTANTSPDPFNPQWVFVTSPAEMKGFEIESLYQLTAKDRMSMGIAYVDAKFVDQSDYFLDLVYLSDIPGIPPWTVTASYDHTFHLPHNSSLNFRAAGRLIASHLSCTLARETVASGYEPYATTADGGVLDLSATWASATGRYAVTAYGRNITDNRYKSAVWVNGIGDIVNIEATQYDPQTFGIVLDVAF